MNKKRTLIYFFIFLIFVGIFFRFYNIDKKIYWGDEVTTSWFISGYNMGTRFYFLGDKIVDMNTFRKYHSINDENSITDMLKLVQTDDAVHCPLYFILLRGWGKLFGSSVTALRSLSVLFSIIFLIFTYYLLKELSRSEYFALMGSALTALSPIHILYAHNARPYMLLSLITIASSFFLLKSINKKGIKNWIFYIIFFVLGIYTHIFFFAVIAFHVLYCLVSLLLKLIQKNKFKQFIISSTTGLILSLHLLFTFINNFGKGMKSSYWLKEKEMFLFDVLESIFQSFGRTVFDINQKNILIYGFIFLVFLSLIIFSLIKNNKKIDNPSLFLICFATVPLICIITLTIISSMKFILVTRYLLPSLIGFQFLLFFSIWKGINNKKTRIFFYIILVLIISSSLTSTSISSQKENWWSHPAHKFKWEKIINTINKDQPVLIIHDYLALTYALSNKINYNVSFYLLNNETLFDPKISKDFKRTFLFSPNNKELEFIQRFYETTKIQGGTFELKPKTDNSSIVLQQKTYTPYTPS